MGALGPLTSVVQMGLGLRANEEEGRAKEAEAMDNARLAQTAASDATQRGARESGQARMQGTRVEGAQRVAYAASGVDGTVGTAAKVAGDTRAISELDAKTLENNAAREAWGFKTFGTKYQAQAALEATRGKYRTASTLLTGAGQLAASAGKAQGE